MTSTVPFRDLLSTRREDVVRVTGTTTRPRPPPGSAPAARADRSLRSRCAFTVGPGLTPRRHDGGPMSTFPSRRFVRARADRVPRGLLYSSWSTSSRRSHLLALTSCAARDAVPGADDTRRCLPAPKPVEARSCRAPNWQYAVRLGTATLPFGHAFTPLQLPPAPSRDRPATARCVGPRRSGRPYRDGGALHSGLQPDRRPRRTSRATVLAGRLRGRPVSLSGHLARAPPDRHPPLGG